MNTGFLEGMKKALYIAFLLFLLALPLGFAKEGSMKLLAVKESNGGFNGSIADLHLEIKDGSGRVFFDQLYRGRTLYAPGRI